MDVLYKLWEGSWDDDAIIADRENNVFADPAKIRPIFHEGTHFKVEGPHLPSPSRQRTPVLFSATASGAGTRFAGRHTEVVVHRRAERRFPEADHREHPQRRGRGRPPRGRRQVHHPSRHRRGQDRGGGTGQARRVRAAVQPRGLPRSRGPDVRSDQVPVGDQAQGHRRHEGSVGRRRALRPRADRRGGSCPVSAPSTRHPLFVKRHARRRGRRDRRVARRRGHRRHQSDPVPLLRHRQGLHRTGRARPARTRPARASTTRNESPAGPHLRRRRLPARPSLRGLATAAAPSCPRPGQRYRPSPPDPAAATNQRKKTR